MGPVEDEVVYALEDLALLEGRPLTAKEVADFLLSRKVLEEKFEAHAKVIRIEMQKSHERQRREAGADGATPTAKRSRLC